MGRRHREGKKGREETISVVKEKLEERRWREVRDHFGIINKGQQSFA